MITDNQWQQLRDKYFKECIENYHGKIIPLIAPHDLFEWFKREIKKLE